MKGCAEYEPLISAFLDGTLSEDERTEVAAHLAGCPACQKYFDDLVAIHDAFDRAEVPAPEGFSDRVMARVRETPQEETGRKAIRIPRWGRWAALAACCAVVALGAWSIQLQGMKTASQTALSSNAEIMSRDAAAPGAVGTPAALMDDAAAPQDAASDAADSIGAGSRYTGRNQKSADEDAVYIEDMEVPLEAALPAPALAAEGANACCGTCGTITAEGPAARAWVEETLGLEWEIGRIYSLTEEEYAELLEALTAACEDFQLEPGDSFRLLAA